MYGRNIFLLKYRQTGEEIIESRHEKICYLRIVHLKFSEPRNVEYNEVFLLLINDVHEF